MGFISIILLDVWMFLIPFVCCQPAKIPGEWKINMADKYPDPMKEPVRCRMPSKSRLCDINDMLPENRTFLANELEKLEGNLDSNEACLCNKACNQSLIVMRVALMKHIGPDITDFRAEAEKFAISFRELWALGDCSVVIVGSVNDHTSYLATGQNVSDLISKNKTNEIDWKVHNDYFQKQNYSAGINEAIAFFSNALNNTAALTSTPTPTPTPPGNPAYIIVPCVIVAVIIIIIIIAIFWKKSQKKQKPRKELQSLNPSA